MISHDKSHGTSGFFWLNTAEMQIDVLTASWDADSGISLSSDRSRINTLWMSEAGIVDAFFFVGPKPKDMVRQYTSVTGTPAMPQFFFLFFFPDFSLFFFFVFFNSEFFIKKEKEKKEEQNGVILSISNGSTN